MSKMKQEDGFSNLHPASNATFFLLQFLITMFSGNLILQGISALSGFLYLCVRTGKQALKSLGFGIVALVLATIINPLFSHEGATIITYFWNDNPLTLESIYYGFGMGVMLLASILWFQVLNQIMTTEKWIHLFGRVMPSLSLLFSMVLRFLPKLNRQSEMLREVHKNTSSIKLFSMLLTWGLETSVDTADSMSARGYGVGRRSSFTLFRFSGRDIGFVMSSLVFCAVVILNLLLENVVFYYYPVIYIGEERIFILLTSVFYFVFSMMPLAVDVKEKLKWMYLESKI